MNWLTGVFSYLLIWWTVIFAVLPLGVRRNPLPQTGTDAGAPERPDLKRKFLITTFVSLAIWLVVYGLIASGILSIHDMISDWRE